MTCCTPKCKDNCYTIDIEQLNSLLNGIHRYNNIQADLKAGKVFYNYGKGIDETLLYELSIYRDYITKIKERLINSAQQCVCEEDIQTVIEKVIDIIPKELCGEDFVNLSVDSSGFDLWLMDNPNCSGAAEWEKLSYKVCTGLGIEVKLTKQKQCDITFDISRKLMDCELLYIVNIVNKSCELGYTVKRTEEECDLDWELLLGRVDCNVSLEEYKNMVSKGLTYDMILQVYEMGASLSVDGNECILRTARGTEYTFSELDLRKIPTKNDLNTEFTTSPDLDLLKYVNDYKLTQEQINSLQNG